MHTKKFYGNGVSKYPVEVRFWAKVAVKESNECWEWLAGKDKDGYGRFRYGKQKARANKVAWEITNGSIPTGRLICHTCNNPKCVNPNHLYLGTHKSNVDDRQNSGNGYYLKGENRFTKGHPIRRDLIGTIAFALLTNGISFGEASLFDSECGGQ